MNELPPLLKDDNGPLIVALFNWVGPPCLTLVRKKLKVCDAPAGIQLQNKYNGSFIFKCSNRAYTLDKIL